MNSKEDYIRYRFQRAEDAFDDALILFEKQKWNATVNRLYYACFYAVIALLLTNNQEIKSHDGARNQFNNHYIKSGTLDKKHGQLFSKLFDYRQKGDYGDFFDFSKDVVIPLFEQVKEFLTIIKKHLNHI